MKNLEFMSRWHFGSDWCSPPPPPQENEIVLNMNAIEKNHFKWGHQVHFTIYPPPPPPLPSRTLSDFMYAQKIVHFNFKWIFENLNFWFSDDSDIRVRWWNQKKGPLSHWKMKCSFLDYVQFLMIGWAIQVMNVNQNAKKGPPCHQKIKCSFLYYVQLLMISQVIQVTKVDQNAK